MNCAWCNPSDNGTDGICDDCMTKHFNVNPASIHQEIEAEEQALLFGSYEEQTSVVYDQTGRSRR
jgi:hypothetical protein